MAGANSAEPMVKSWQALAADPNSSENWIEAGTTLWKTGRRDEAQAVLASVLDRWPAEPAGWLAAATTSASREAAEAACRRAVALAPKSALAWLRLGEAVSPQQPEEALGAFETARVLDSAAAAAHRGAGLALTRLRRWDEARAALERAVTLQPNDSAAHRGLARWHLEEGDPATGWAHWARGVSSVARDTEWDGGDLSGQAITLIADGGLDQAVPLFGLIPLLAAKAGKVIVAAPASWLPLLESVEGIAALVPLDKKPLPAGPTIALSRLPWRMDWTERKPPRPRISPKPIALPQVPCGTRLKVGLLWASGMGEDYTVGLPALLPLTGLAGVAFYGLQTGPRAADIRKVADPILIADLSSTLKDLGALAATVAQLDLVITIDGPMVDLAQAVGKPVWLVAPPYDEASREEGPGLRVFRQHRAGDWRKPVEDVTAALNDLVARRPQPATETADIAVNAIFPNKDGKPRFRMTAPRHFYPDPGIRYLVDRERSGVGYEYATRSFIDAHLRPGDLFIDIGAHWGIMSLQAVTRWPGQVNVLAIEPSPQNVPHLRKWLADNSVAAQVDIVHAFAADAPGKGALKPQSTMGHSLIRDEEGTIPVVTVDSLLAERPVMAAADRVVIKIDVEGHEPEVIDGMKALLASGKVAAVIWERGREYDTPKGLERLSALREKFASLGFAAWRFDSEDQAGPLVPFIEDGRLGNVFELAAGEVTSEAYGLPRPERMSQPADPVWDAAVRARSLFSQGLAAHRNNKTTEAREFYRHAAALDGTQSGPFNNMAAILRDQSNRAAAAASFRRALSLSPRDLGVMSNCGNALRDNGFFAEAEAVLRRALVQKPDEAGLIYNLGVLRKDTDRPEQAVELFERALLLSTADPEYRWDRSLALLQAGDYIRGFEAYESRWGLKRAVKRKIPLSRWDGSPLEGRSLFLSDEQGFGDVLQWARFVAPLKTRGAGRIVMECQPELMRLMSLMPEVEAVVPRAKTVPECDLTLPLLSLPLLFGTTLESLPNAVPYLPAPQTEHRLAEDGRLKLGLVWAGKPTPRDRSIGLEKLLPLLGDPAISAYSFQIGPRSSDLGRLGAELLVTDLAPILTDFAETAALLKQLDLLITIDSAVAHLAGALGVKTFLLLRKVSDWRWFDERIDSPWYPSMTLFRQKRLDVWDDVVEAVAERLRSRDFS